MSTTSLRALAVTVAAIIAVLTGLATGLLSGPKSCAVQQGQPPATATQHPGPTPSTGAGAGLGDAEPAGSSPTAAAAKPVPPPVQQPAAATITCSTGAFGVQPALTAFVGAAFVGGALLLLLLLAARGRDAPRPGAGGRHTGAVAPPPNPAAAGVRGAATSGAPGVATPGARAVAGSPVRAPAGSTAAGARAPAGSTAPPAAGARAPAGRAEADRTALVQAIIYVRDRVTSKALADRLGTALREAGVDTLEPTGVRFDPAQHEAGGSAPSDDPSKIGSIAAVEVPGYADRGGRILRAPVVTVYQGGHPTRGQSRDRTRGEQR